MLGVSDVAQLDVTLSFWSEAVERSVSSGYKGYHAKSIKYERLVEAIEFYL